MRWKAGGRKDTGHDCDGASFEKLEVVRRLYYCEKKGTGSAVRGKLRSLNWNGMHGMVVG